jgi:hypothetical protein
MAKPRKQATLWSDIPTWLQLSVRAAMQALSNYKQDAVPRLAFRNDHCFDVVPTGGWNRGKLVRVCVSGIFLLESTSRMRFCGDVRDVPFVEFTSKIKEAITTHLTEGV